MTAASSICRIRLSCSTTVSTSNWKALAIAVLLPRSEIPDHRYDTIGFYRLATSQRVRPSPVACYPWPSRRECIIPKSPLMDLVHSIDPLYARGIGLTVQHVSLRRQLRERGLRGA